MWLSSVLFPLTFQRCHSDHHMDVLTVMQCCFHAFRCSFQPTRLLIGRRSRSLIGSLPDFTGGRCRMASWMSGARWRRFMICVIRGWVTCARRASSDWSWMMPLFSRWSKRMARAMSLDTRGMRGGSLGSLGAGPSMILLRLDLMP